MADHCSDVQYMADQCNAVQSTNGKCTQCWLRTEKCSLVIVFTLPLPSALQFTDLMIYRLWGKYEKSGTKNKKKNLEYFPPPNFL